MPGAFPQPIRRLVYDRAQLGHTAHTIASDLGLKVDTVRRLMARFRACGVAGIVPAYDHCGHDQPTADSDLIDATLSMRRQHATWGAGLIRVFLTDEFPNHPSVSERTLQRHLSRSGLNPAPAGRRSRNERERATAPHQVWQVDAAERMRLGDQTEASWLRITDECSGAFLRTAVFPPRELEYRASSGHANDLASGFRSVGHAGTIAGGQWNSVGF